MRTDLRKLWESRAPHERMLITVLAVLLGFALYVWLVQSAGEARTRLRAENMALRAQAERLEQRADELEQLRAAPPVSVSQTDLRTLVQARVGAAGLSRALERIDAPDSGHLVVVFGSVAFTDWLTWLEDLRAQHVRLESGRIEALSTQGLVSVTATLVRAGPQ